MNKEVKRASRRMSKLLRHDPEELEMDSNGWVGAIQLCKKLKITHEDLESIVKENNKKRFTLSDDYAPYIKVRANQGHSLDVDVELERVESSPDILYHGTATKNLTFIYEDGIKSMSRTYVHLSDNVDTAANVGSRHGNSIVLNVNAKQMIEDGVEIFISKNGVYLVDYVDPKYFKHEE